MIAEQGGHHRFRAEHAIGGGGGSFQSGKVLLAGAKHLQEGVVQGKLKLPVQSVGADEGVDAGPVHEGFSHEVKGVLGGLRQALPEALPEGGPEFRRDMFHGIQAKSIQTKTTDPVGSILNQKGAAPRLVVEARKKRLKPGGKLGFIVPFTEVFRAIRQQERAEPVRIFFEGGMLLVDVSENQIEKDADVFLVGRFGEGRQRRISAKAWLHFSGTDGPVAMIPGVPAPGLLVFLIGG